MNYECFNRELRNKTVISVAVAINYGNQFVLRHSVTRQSYKEAAQKVIQRSP